MKTALIISTISLLILVTGCQDSKNISYSEGFVNSSDNVNLYYEKIGNGPKIILIPGGMYLSPIFKGLANPKRTLIIYDQRARGRSTSITDSSQIGWRQEIKDIEAIRSYFEFDKISIIGWSYEGAITALYAEKHPQFVERIIQIGPLMPKKDPFWNEYQETLQTRKDSTYDRKIELASSRFKESGDFENYTMEYYKIAHQPLLFNKDVVEVFRNDFYSCMNERPDIVSESTLPMVISSFGNWNFTDQLSKVDMPVLIIHGTYDAIPTAAAMQWNYILKNSRLWIMKDVGHLPFMEKTDEVLSGIDTFLNGIWPNQASNYH